MANSYIIDSKTTNKSFIKMYKVLKNLGIKNNKFFLVLYDKTLQGVNPFDEEKLTIEQKIRINAEVRRNPWYFLRECIRLPVAGGKKRYEIHRGNLAITFCMLNNFNSITMLPRQHGKTIGVICVYIWIYYFATNNSNMLFMNKEFADSKNNLKRFKDIVELLPKYLITKSKKDKDNIEEIQNGTNGNSIRAMSVGITPSEADKKGRGSTTALQYWDEIAFLKYNDLQYGSSVPAASQARLEAKNLGKINGITMTTTPNNVDVPEGKYCHDIIIGQACRFDEAMYDWTLEEIQECIDKKSSNNFLYIEFSYKQLGRDEKWFEQQCKDLMNNMLLIKREILLEWTKATDNSVYSEEQLESIEKFLKEPVAKLTLRKFFTINLYSSEVDFLKPYIIACDVSTGKELDGSTINVINPMTFEVIADFRENKIDTEDFKRLIYELAGKYFINSTIVIENNTVSAGIISWLMKTAVCKRLYYEVKQRPTERIEQSKKELVYVKSKKKTDVYGIVTTKATRPIMFEILDRLIAENPEVLATKYIYSDIKNLERHKGKIEHADGQHDDSLMGYLIGIYCLQYGTNLSKFLIPINGKDPIDRKNSIIRITSELQKANKDTRYNYNGLASDIIEEDRIINRKTSKRFSLYQSLVNMNDDTDYDSIGRVGRDL